MIGHGEDQDDERGLMVGLDIEHIPADALRLLGLVEQPVALRLFERQGDRRRGDGLQLEGVAQPVTRFR